MEMGDLLDEIFAANVTKAVVSNPLSASTARRVDVVRTSVGGNEAYRFSRQVGEQVFHENLDAGEAKGRIASLMESEFRQLDIWNASWVTSMRLSKKGKLLVSRKAAPRETAAPEPHNRKKTYLLEEGDDIPALRALGVFSPDGRLVKAMYRKYRQINRFVEMVDDVVANRQGKIRVLDFGCGKSYLTFVLYHYLTRVRGLEASVIGLDLKPGVIETCNRTAEEFGYAGLSFQVGAIGGFEPREKPDLVISLHACDTATDDALGSAVRWGTEIVLSAPCCQHELNGQIRGGALAALTRYGIVKERFAAAATDAIRGCLLEACGYRTQLLEFVDLEHSPKNILIRAVKGGVADDKRRAARAEAERLMEAFAFSPKLYRLLAADPSPLPLPNGVA